MKECDYCGTRASSIEGISECCPQAEAGTLRARVNVLEMALKKITDGRYLRRLSDARRLAREALGGAG